MPQLFIELFSEEIPARMQAGAARDLERLFKAKLDEAGLKFDSLKSFVSPRRLVLVVEGLPAAQEDRIEELKGPKVGAPAQALEGFLRKTGLTADQLVEQNGVLFAKIEQKGRPTPQIVAEGLEAIIRSFPWPKSMRWGTGSLRWVRPLKRIIALYDGAVVPLNVDGIEASNITEGHRFHGSRQPFAVSDFADYQQKLAADFVVLDQAERKRLILERATMVVSAAGLELVEDEGLLDEVSGLAEWPTPVLGQMDPSFLTLPPEVIRTSMRTHQKYFAVRDPKTGKLAPNFVTVANVEAADGGEEIKRGNAKVLSARLNDARFFWDEDQKGANFDRWLEKLKGVTFHAKLGTMAERVERIAKLSRALAPLVGADADMAEQAARLSKADLASGMVGEFPELQGIMGGYYAEAKGLDQGLADAVRDHYRPQGPSDTVPTAPLSLAVALADKLDTLVGFFAIDEKPTGSKDPFALRRAALGIVRLILTAKVRVSLKSVLESALSQFPQGAADTVSSLEAFFADRLKVQLKDEGVASDLVDAVFALGDDDLVRVVARVEALKAMLSTEDGKNLLAGYKRAANILAAEAKKGAQIPQATDAFVQLDNAQPEVELALRAQLAEIEPKVREFLQKETFSDAVTALSSLRLGVDAFLEGVLVNSEIPQERMNRLTLLVKVRDLMGLCADFSKVTG